MHQNLKSVAVPTMILAALGFSCSSASAQSVRQSDVHKTLASAPDGLCTYCDDYLRAPLSGGPVKTAYKPGIGYPLVGISLTMAPIVSR